MTNPSMHQRILGDIEGRILSGEWPPGSRIPFEHELSAQYACARMTVNKALTQLAKAGLIERRRKVGSFVTRPLSRSAVLEIPDVKSEVAALGRPYRFEILNRRRRRESSRASAPGRCLNSPVFIGRERSLSALRNGSSILRRRPRRRTKPSQMQRPAHGCSRERRGLAPSTISALGARMPVRPNCWAFPRAQLAFRSRDAPGAVRRQ